MTQPRRDKDNNIIAGPIGKPRTVRKLKPGIAGIGLSPVKRKKNTAKRVKEISNEGLAVKAGIGLSPVKRKKNTAKRVKAPSKLLPNLKKMREAVKTAQKKNKQLSGFQAIAKRKEARAKAAGKTYDMAKSNPRLAQKIAGKKAAIAKTGVMIEPVLKNPPKQRKTKKTSF